MKIIYNMVYTFDNGITKHKETLFNTREEVERWLHAKGNPLIIDCTTEEVSDNVAEQIESKLIQA